MGKVLLKSESDVQYTSVVERLKGLVRDMETGDYTESDAAVLITRDKATGIVTISHITEGGVDETRALFDEAAKLNGYAKVV